MSTSIMRLVLAALIAPALMFLLSGSTAYANDTPSVCDADVKYYCSKVNYDSNALGGWNINHRYYKGGRDGGATSWQLYYARDWYWSGSQWLLQTDWGQAGGTPIIGWTPIGAITVLRFLSLITPLQQ